MDVGAVFVTDLTLPRVSMMPVNIGDWLIGDWLTGEW
jgi:hypothetical protein